MRNVTGRENLITCGQTNELACPPLYGQNILVKALCQQNRTRWHWVKLPSSTEKYGECTQLCAILLSTLHVTHVKNYSRPSTAFFILQAMESWVGPGNEATALKATGLITFA